MYNQFGPTARICFEIPKRKSHLNKHQHRFEAALSSVSSKVLREIIAEIFDIDKADIYLTILLLKRLPGDDFSLATVEIITPTAKTAVRDQLGREPYTQRYGFYRDLASVDVSRRIVGIVYESLAQNRLLDATLDLFPMVQRTPDGPGPRKKLPRWYSNHGDDASSLAIHIPSANIVTCTFVLKPDPIENNVFYARKSHQAAAVHSFIMYGNRLYIFQFTNVTEHDINEDILSFFSQASLPPRKNWYFVFIIPPNLSGLSCSQGRDEMMKEFLEEIHLCSVVVSP